MGDYKNLIIWYRTKGYDFDDDKFNEEMKSGDDIKDKVTTLKDFAEDISSVSKKPFSKGQKEGLRKALESDAISGEFERNLHKREIAEQVRAEQYTAEVKRIVGLAQISAAEEFESEYKDIEETLEMQNAKKVRETVKGEIVERMAIARAEKEAELYSPAMVEEGIRRGAESGETVSTILKVNLPGWMLKERGTEYETYKEMAEEEIRAEAEREREIQWKKLLKRREEE